MGIDISRYSAGLLDTVRSLRLIKNGIDVQNLLGLSADEIGGLKSAVQPFDDEELSRIFKTASELVRNLRFSGNDRVYLEMALLDMAAIVSTPSISDIIRRLEEDGASEAHQAGHAPVSQPMQGRPAAGRPAQDKSEEGDAGGRALGAWRDMLSDLELKKNRLHLILRPAKVTCGEAGVLTLSYPEGVDSAAYIKTLDAPAVAFIESNLSRRAGFAVKVLLSGQSSALPPVRVNEPSPEEAGVDGDDSPLPEAEMIQKPESEDYRVESPAVSKIQNAFYGEIIKKGE